MPPGTPRYIGLPCRCVPGVPSDQSGRVSSTGRSVCRWGTKTSVTFTVCDPDPRIPRLRSPPQSGMISYWSRGTMKSMLRGRPPSADGGRPRNIDFIVPRDQYEIIPDWGGDRSLGMRGSGSQTVKVTDVFVPHRHTLRPVLLTLPDWSDGTPGTHLHGNPMYLGVPGGIYHATFTAILTGTAYAAIDEYEDIMRRKTTMGGQLRVHDPASQSALGEAMVMTHAAEAIGLSVAAEYMAQCRRWQETGERITAEDTFKLWATAQKGCYLACDAVEVLFRSASASSSHT